MSVNKSTAKSISYGFLGIASISFLAAIYLTFENNNSGNKSSDFISSKNLMVLSSICIVAAASAGMAWKSQNKVQASSILNFISACIASLLVGLGAYRGWDILALSMGALIGLLTGFEFVVDN